MKWHGQLKTFLTVDKDLHKLHDQYHYCWWPGDARGQVINSHGIDLVYMEYYSFSTREIDNHVKTN